MTYQLNRRGILAALAAGGVMALHESPVAAGKSRPFFQRINKPIGLQLYTLGEDIAKDIDATLANVANIGFRDLQLPQLYGQSPSALKAAADRAGVTISCIHLAATPNTPATALSMLSETQRIVDDLGALGATGGVMPIMLFPKDFSVRQGESFPTALARALREDGFDTWKRTAALLNEKAAALKPHGIRIWNLRPSATLVAGRYSAAKQMLPWSSLKSMLAGLQRLALIRLRF